MSPPPSTSEIDWDRPLEWDDGEFCGGTKGHTVPGAISVKRGNLWVGVWKENPAHRHTIGRYTLPSGNYVFVRNRTPLNSLKHIGLED